MRAWALSVWSLALVACSSSVTGTTSSDCAQSPDKASCNACYAKQYPGGVSDYNAVATCVFCSACYTSCGSETSASFCAGPPPNMDECDTGDCAACQKCSTTSVASCKGTVQSCLSNSDCNALLGATCP